MNVHIEQIHKEFAVINNNDKSQIYFICKPKANRRPMQISATIKFNMKLTASREKK